MFFKPSNDAALSAEDEVPSTEKRRLDKAVAAQDAARLAAALRDPKGSTSPEPEIPDAETIH